MVIGNTEFGGLVNDLTSKHGADVCTLAMMRQVCIGAVRNLGAKSGVDFSNMVYMLHACIASHMMLTETSPGAVDRVSADANHAFAVASLMRELSQ
jgi:hypothetical protein